MPQSLPLGHTLGMSVRVGLVSGAHVHAPSFIACLQANPKAEFVGLWDDRTERGEALARQYETHFTPDLGTLLGQVDAVCIASENMRHLEHIQAAVKARKHILCEKPIAPNADHARQIAALAETEGLVMATAFPCPFSPNFALAQTRVANGDIGTLLAACCTNQGRCPFGWFTEPELSGGGAMIDHVVHVADLLRRLFGPNATHVQAQTGNGHYGKTWDDTALVTLGFEGGSFASIDSSWNRPSNYHTWGNVKLNLVGEKGVIELDLFSQGAILTDPTGVKSVGTGSNLDALMVGDFLDAILEGRAPMSTLNDGLWASQIAIKAYESVAQAGQPAMV